MDTKQFPAQSNPGIGEKAANLVCLPDLLCFLQVGKW